MGKGERISQYRERMDKSLASADLKNEGALVALVRNQLQYSSVSESEGCSEDVVAKRAGEVSNFIGMLRSASVNNNEPSRSGESSDTEWKLKDDNEEYRVMYRPGPEGSPFHSLLVEGCIDGPVDVCLCVSWEATLYKKWWPQFTFPPFKITQSECLQRIRLGEQVCLVRMKVPWPMSSREAVVHYYMFEYLQDDLIILLFNTIPDVEHIDKSTHGFTKDGIPEAKEVVRIDVVGGVALQKVTAERSYFRTIASMDMKLDFVPPSLINFISRQLIGSGFRFYQKTIASLSRFDQDYSKVLEDPMYAKMRRAFSPAPESNEEVEANDMNGHSTFLLQKGKCQSDARLEAEALVMQTTLGGGSNEKADAIETSSDNGQMQERKAHGEIEEEDDAGNEHLQQEISNGKVHVASLENGQMQERKAHGEIEEEDGAANGPVQQEISNGKVHVAEVFQNDVLPTDECVTYQNGTDESTPSDIEKDDGENDRPLDESVAYQNRTDKRTPIIRPDVQEALETLEKAISLVRRRREIYKEERKDGERRPSLSEVCTEADVPAEVVVEDGKIPERSSHESRRSSSSRDIRRAGGSSSTRETNNNKVVPASPEQHQSPLNGSDDAHHKATSISINGVRLDRSKERKELRRKYSLCCFASTLDE